MDVTIDVTIDLIIDLTIDPLDIIPNIVDILIVPS